MATSDCGSRTEGRLKSTSVVRLKMVVLAPMARARQAMAGREKAGVRRRARAAERGGAAGASGERDWQGGRPAEEHLGGQAEDGGVGADGKGEAGDGGEGEGGVAAEAAGGVAEVGGEVFEAAELPGGKGVLGYERGGAELAAGLGEGGGPG